MAGNFLTAVTTSFTANTKAKSAEVNTNFDDLCDAIADGTMDLNVGNVWTGRAAKSADYTILDNDGVRTFVYTAGAANRTLTLPTLADNLGRSVVVHKTDAGAGNIIIDGEGAETINGAATLTLFDRYEAVELLATATEWIIVHKFYNNLDPAEIKVSDTTDNFGSTNTLVKRFATTDVNDGKNSLTLTNSATDGDKITINATGVYSITATSTTSSGGPNKMSIMKNTIVYGETVEKSLHQGGIPGTTADSYNSLHWTGTLVATDIIRLLAAEPASTTYNYTWLHVVRLA